MRSSRELSTPRASSGAADPQAGYALSLTNGPEQGDTVVENDGARVYVDPAATVQLDDRVLDARVDENGGVSFALAQRR
ncbi:hypothetical protein [Microbacterium aurum]